RCSPRLPAHPRGYLERLGTGGGVLDQSISAFGAFGKESSSTRTWPVKRLPVLSWARRPLATNALHLTRRASSAFSLSSIGLAMRDSRRMGYMARPTGKLGLFRTRSYSRLIDLTSPMLTPRNSTGAPTDSP